MYTVSIETEFSAAHTLRNYNGHCARPHGHNWKVTVEVISQNLNNIGMSIDFYDLQNKTDNVIANLDHQDLNTIPPFNTINPTSENIAKYIYTELKNILPKDLKLSYVSIGETGKYTAKYSE